MKNEKNGEVNFFGKYYGLSNAINFLEDGHTLIYGTGEDMVFFATFLCGDAPPIIIGNTHYYKWKKANDVVAYWVGDDGAHCLKLMKTTDPAKFIKLMKKRYENKDLQGVQREHVFDKIHDEIHKISRGGHRDGSGRKPGIAPSTTSKTIRCNPEEWSKIQAAAIKTGLSTSKFVISSALAAAGKTME